MRTLFLLVYISGAAAAPLSFFGVGDWGAPDPLLQDRVASSMAATADAMATPPAFVLALGDNFYEKGVASVDDRQFDATWRDVWLPKSERLRHIPWLAVLGNHDYHHGDEGARAQVDRTERGDDDEWQMPTVDGVYERAFARHAVRVVAFGVPDRAAREGGDARAVHDDAARAVAARARALAAAHADARTQWLFVVAHYPVLSVGEHGDTPALRATVQPLLEQDEADAYLCGHTHTLQHLEMRGVHYLVSGGGSKADGAAFPALFALEGRVTHFARAALGFSAHEISTDGLTMKTIFVSIDGEVLHSATQRARRARRGSRSRRARAPRDNPALRAARSARARAPCSPSRRRGSACAAPRGRAARTPASTRPCAKSRCRRWCWLRPMINTCVLFAFKSTYGDLYGGYGGGGGSGRIAAVASSSAHGA